MAVIAQTNGALSAAAAVPLTRTTLGASDTLTHVRGARQVLVLTNPTASVITVTLTGSAPSPVTPDGYGGTISTTGGKAIAVAANGSTLVDLDDIWAFLDGNGTVTATGGTGAYAVLFTP